VFSDLITAEKTVEIVVSYYVNCIEHHDSISEEKVMVGQDVAGFYFYQSRAMEVLEGKTSC